MLWRQNSSLQEIRISGDKPCSFDDLLSIAGPIAICFGKFNGTKWLHFSQLSTDHPLFTPTEKARIRAVGLDQWISEEIARTGKKEWWLAGDRGEVDEEETVFEEKLMDIIQPTPEREKEMEESGFRIDQPFTREMATEEKPK